MLRREPAWLGLVDKDEWLDDEISARQQELPNLLVLPRFCMENYLIVPDEIWSVMPNDLKQQNTDGLSDLQARLYHNLDMWVRHGVLWSVINPLWYNLRSIGFNTALLQTGNVSDDAFIYAKLQEWQSSLDPDPLFQEFQTRLAQVHGLPHEEKLRKWVHGKKFWPEVVVPALNHLTDEQKGEKGRRINLWRTLTVPADWQPIWQRL